MPTPGFDPARPGRAPAPTRRPARTITHFGTRSGARRLTAVVALAALAVASGATAASASAKTPARTSKGAKSVSLAGVTLTFGDQLKGLQTVFAATDTLKGAPYTVNWANFVGGPPVIAAETSGSVDLGFMAETPTIFAQSAGDPVKVVAATIGDNPKVSPYDVVVPAGSPIKSVAQLRGHSVAVQEGTVEQYFLVQELAKAHVPYTGVQIDNLTVTNASTAVANGQVDAAVITQPLTGLDQSTGKITILATGAGVSETIGYLTASDAALANPQKAAAIDDFVVRYYKAEAQLRKDPLLAAQTYTQTYGVPLAVAKEAVAADQGVGTPITPAIIAYQQNEADTFQKLGLVTGTLDVKKIFDLPFNQTLAKQAGLTP